jgi:hypothetical protein
MTESILLHPVYQQETFMNIFYTDSPWFATFSATIHNNDGLKPEAKKYKKL